MVAPVAVFLWAAVRRLLAKYGVKAGIAAAVAVWGDDVLVWMMDLDDLDEEVKAEIRAAREAAAQPPPPDANAVIAATHELKNSTPSVPEIVARDEDERRDRDRFGVEDSFEDLESALCESEQPICVQPDARFEITHRFGVRRR